jgi:hypothetical protein
VEQPTGQPPDRPPGYQPGYRNQADYQRQPPPRPPNYPPPPYAFRPEEGGYRGPAKTAHGPIYWTLVGWWWGPLKWLGRVLLWLAFWPIGLWRSIRHHQDTQEGKQRRGYR